MIHELPLERRTLHGEVSGTAIECASSARLTLDLLDDLRLDWPCARVDALR